MKLIFILFIFFSIFAVAQDANVFKPDTLRKEIIATSFNGSLKIDGNLDEKEWRQAISSSRFIQIEPLQGQLPHFSTDVKILYNKQNLYC